MERNATSIIAMSSFYTEPINQLTVNSARRYDIKAQYH